MRTKVSWSLLVAALAAVIVIAVPAAATGSDENGGFDPQATNVPTLAWNGEIVRLVKCYEDDLFERAGVTQTTFWDRFTAEYNVMSWTGNPAQPPTIVEQTVDVGTSYGRTCVRADMVSVEPGLAQVELDLIDKHAEIAMPPHVFLVAWMNLGAPTVSEVPNAGLTALSSKQDTGQYGVVADLKPSEMVQKSGLLLGDPTLNVFTPLPDANGVNYLLDGLVRVSVTGQFPKAGGGMWTMPADWAALAAQYESDSVSPTGHDPMFWDVHDLLSWDPLQLTTDTVWSLHEGPFDPLLDGTYLPNGVLDPGDAPMPAARVDLDIAAGGVGGFDAVDKTTLYTADASVAFTGSNAYAPFYTQHIPATTASEWASGIAGPASGNNFLGFLVDGEYDNWALLNGLVTNEDREENPNVCKDELGQIRQSPEGVDDTVTVYTDEHGEAYVAYDPDEGFYFRSDSNNRCDLGTGTAPVLLGTSTIGATARYPYKPVAPVAGIPSSTTLTKQVFGLPSNTLTCVPKDAMTAFCVQTVKDIYGNPVQGAVLQFTVEPTGAKLVPAKLVLGGYDTTGMTIESTDPMTLVTGPNGQVGVEVISSLAGRVDLLSESLLTRAGGAGILRDALITFGSTTPTATYPVVTAPPAWSSVVGEPVTAKSVPAKPTVVQKPTVVARTRVVSAKIVVTKLGRFLNVRVTSPNKTAKIKITLVKKGGKIYKVVTRTVKTNKLVRVPSLKIPKIVVSTRVGAVR
jgi:hypothetical protein